MKALVRSLALLTAGLAGYGGQVVQSDYFVVNAGLTKALEAPAPTSVALSRDGSMLAAVDKAGTVWLYSGGNVAGKAQAHAPGRSAVAFGPFGDSFATWGPDQKIALWDTKSAAPIKTIDLTGAKPSAMAFSGDGTRVACGADDGTIRVLELAAGKLASTCKAHSRAVLALAFEPSGTSVVSVGADRQMTTFDAASGQVLRQKFMPVKVKFDSKPEDEFQQIRSAACTPDGSIFAVGGYNLYRQLGGMPISFEFVVLYDRSGRRLVQIGDKTMRNLSLGVSISPDGKLVATSAPNGMARIWDVQHNQLCGQIIGQGAIRQTAASRSGNNYLFGIAGNKASVVAVSPAETSPSSAGDSPKAASDGLTIDDAAPTEMAPIVNTPAVEVSAIVRGLKTAPRYTIQIAGRSSEAATLQVSDSRDLVLAPASGSARSAAPASAAKLADDTVRISQNVVLSEGPNRVKVTVQDGSRQVSAVKTICFVPEGDQVDRAKVYGHSYALVVGVDKYGGKGAKNIPSLGAAVADAKAVAEILKSRFGFGDVTLLTDSEATHDRVMAALSELTDANRISPNDRVLVFWSGHGQTVTMPEGGQMGFLLPSDAQVDLRNLDNIKPYRDSCLPMDDLARLAREIPAKHVLFLIDACFSGLAATAGSSYPSNAFSLVHQAYFDAKQIITASSQFEPAKEKDGHGYFTRALLEGLEDPAADANGDGFLTASELFRYLQPKVQALNSNQSPRLAKFSLGIGENLFFK